MSTIEADIKSQGPKGLGGWLILPALGLLISPLILAYALEELIPLFRGSGWGVLTTPGSPHYHPLWVWAILFNFFATVSLLIFDLVLIILFFKKLPNFPRLYIAFLSINFVFAVILYVLMRSIPEVPDSADNSLLIELFKSTIAALIWIPYMLVSKRVKNTFVADQK